MNLPFLSKLPNKRAHMQLVEHELKQIRVLIEEQVSCFTPAVMPYMRHVCKGQGKMLRPGLVLLTAAATGGIKPEHRIFAAMLEMIHVSSLVHDDVLDKADTRRDVPTANALWGNNLAVLLGDVLFSQAMIMGSNIGDDQFSKRMAIVVRDLCQGEVEQSTRLWDVAMTREDYYRLIRMKTATLFAAAMEGAARLQGLPEEQVLELKQIGDLLGISYQIYDDCLDISGLDEAAGKTLGTDSEKGKLTLPIFLLMESRDTEVANYVKLCIQERVAIDFSRIRGSIGFDEALRATIAEGCACNDQAQQLITKLPASRARQALAEMIARLDAMLRAQGPQD